MVTVSPQIISGTVTLCVLDLPEGTRTMALTLDLTSLTGPLLLQLDGKAPGEDWVVLAGADLAYPPNLGPQEVLRYALHDPIGTTAGSQLRFTAIGETPIGAGEVTIA